MKRTDPPNGLESGCYDVSIRVSDAEAEVAVVVLLAGITAYGRGRPRALEEASVSGYDSGRTETVGKSATPGWPDYSNSVDSRTHGDYGAKYRTDEYVRIEAKSIALYHAESEPATR
ncbi:hypothetical protein [Haloterrigena alkaliphila]|uniref:Uncharacterized protein n=1 Tax=Haloterrigena alkaliphila TaxID=2816475 RepID=A0A8A2VEV7_9EURY|nr:hypothetical protein [Haloterrigena alkaliphila]QSX00042.1 hypothetical protein J0X25_03490 [Haloterrigena alkaliphila]